MDFTTSSTSWRSVGVETNDKLQGKSSTEETDENSREVDRPTLSLFHDELDNEDYIFRTDISE